MNRQSFSGLYLIIAIIALTVAGCGGGGSDKDDVQITLLAERISEQTAEGYFTLGRNINFSTHEPYGGIAEKDQSGDPWEASIRFYDVPEGEYTGTGYHGFQIIELDPSLPLGYCYLEGGTSGDVLNVVSGGRNRVVELDPAPTACLGEVAFDRFIVNPNYEFDFVHRAAGSIDGENIITGYVQRSEASSPIVVRANPDDLTVSPFGVFSALPDTTQDAWLAPADWLGRLDTLTDVNGQVAFFLVVKPGTPPMTWEIEVLTAIGTEELLVRISNGNVVSLTTE